MLATMQKTSASPDKILLRGKTYNLPKEEFDIFAAEKAAIPAAPGAKVTKVPLNPDPEGEPDYE